MAIRISYNAPVVLSFSFICVIVYLLKTMTYGTFDGLFSLHPVFNFTSMFSYLSLFTYVLGHATTDHLIGNLSFVLLLGPLMEEKYGSKTLLIMMLFTAVCTGILNIFLFREGLWGASGIVFMLIMLSSFSNARQGQIPLTFVLVIVLFVGKEVIAAFRHDNVSQFAHIIGGVIGSVFGFISNSSKPASHA